jgi:outer membrane biosynthesis protein TonB
MLLKGALPGKLAFAWLAIGLCLTTAQAQGSQSAGAPPSTQNPGTLLEASAIKRVEPAYPPLVKAAKVGGSVVVEVTVDDEGNVIAARAVSGHPLL